MDEAVKTKVCDLLRTARQRSGLSYAGFAAAIGLSKASVSRYESGAWPIPRKVELAILGFQKTQGGQHG